MPEKKETFYADPFLMIFVAVPASKSMEAMRQLRIMANSYRLRIEVMAKIPAPDMPKALMHTVKVMPNYKIRGHKNSAKRLVKAGNDLTAFKSQFEATVFNQNLPQNIRKQHGI